MAYTAELGLDITDFERKLRTASTAAARESRQMGESFRRNARAASPISYGTAPGGDLVEQALTRARSQRRITAEMEQRLRGAPDMEMMAAMGQARAMPRGAAGKSGGVLPSLGFTAGGIAVVAGAAAAMDAFNAAVDREAQLAGLAANSTEDVGKQLERIQEIAKKPGVGLAQGIDFSSKLQSVGLSASLAEGALEQFGNALSLAGKGKADLDGISLALTQIMGKGKISAEEINQIAERTPQIRKVMQSQFGSADAETIQAMGIGAEQFIAKIVEGLSQLQRAPATMRTELENMSDSLHEVKVAAGEIVSEFAKVALPPVKQWLDGVNAGIKDLKDRDLTDVDRRRSQGKSYRIGNDVFIDAPADRRAEDAQKYQQDFFSLMEDPQRQVDAAAARKKQAAAEDKAFYEFNRAGNATSYQDLLAQDQQKRNAQLEDEAFTKFNLQREAQLQALRPMREQSESGAYALLSRKDQIAQLRGQLSQSLGISVTSGTNISGAIADLRGNVAAAQQRGDLEGEKQMRQRLNDAQDQALRLSQLSAGGPRASIAGSAQRGMDAIFGRGGSLVGEGQKQTRLLEDVKKVLTEIEKKAGLDFSL